MRRTLAATGMVLMGLVCIMALSCEKVNVEQAGTCGATPVLAADSLSLEEYEDDIRVLAKDQAKLIAYKAPRDTLHQMMCLAVEPDHYVVMCTFLDAIDDTQDSTILALIGEMRSIQTKYATLCTFRISRPYECLDWDGESAVPVFYVGPLDESQTNVVYAYDADGNELMLSAVNVPTIVVLGIEGYSLLLNVGGSKDAPGPPHKDWAEYWVMRVGSIEIYNDNEPWYKGTPEVFTRMIYDYEWPRWIGWDSKNIWPYSIDPSDDRWDIFEDANREHYVYSYENEYHYYGDFRVAWCSESPPWLYVQLLEMDWPDIHDKLAEVPWENESPLIVEGDYGRMVVYQGWEYHSTRWDADPYPND